ncbi:MAG: hypothetical protein H6955_05340 [Chromatiaceae bacterium]|nr:hypothetical protein [Chromatiaceae bacterium]
MPRRGAVGTASTVAKARWVARRPRRRRNDRLTAAIMFLLGALASSLVASAYMSMGSW